MRNGIAANKSCGDVSVVMEEDGSRLRPHFSECTAQLVENSGLLMNYFVKRVGALAMLTMATETFRILPVIARATPLLLHVPAHVATRTIA